MGFPGGNLLELSLAPTPAGYTGVHGLSVFSSVGLCHSRGSGDSSVNSNFVFSAPAIGGKLLVMLLSRSARHISCILTVLGLPLECFPE